LSQQEWRLLIAFSQPPCVHWWWWNDLGRNAEPDQRGEQQQ
jgi:hypothetical protein